MVKGLKQLYRQTLHLESTFDYPVSTRERTNTDRTCAGFWVIGMSIEPDKIGHPIGMTITYAES